MFFLYHVNRLFVIPLIMKPALDVEILKTIDLYQICRYYLKLLKRLMHLVLFRTLRITLLLINFNLRTSAVTARKPLYSVCIVIYYLLLAKVIDQL